MLAPVTYYVRLRTEEGTLQKVKATVNASLNSVEGPEAQLAEAVAAYLEELQEWAGVFSERELDSIVSQWDYAAKPSHWADGIRVFRFSGPSGSVSVWLEPLD